MKGGDDGGVNGEPRSDDLEGVISSELLGYLRFSSAVCSLEPGEEDDRMKRRMSGNLNF